MSYDWRYNATKDIANFYQIQPDSVKGTVYKINIEKNKDDTRYKKGDNLTVTNGMHTEKVHVFIAKNFLTKVKYWFLKHFSNNWTEIELEGQNSFNKLSTRKIKVLVDNEDLVQKDQDYGTGHINKSLISMFMFALSPKIKKQVDSKIVQQIPSQRELTDWLTSKNKLLAIQQKVDENNKQYHPSKNIKILRENFIKLDQEGETRETSEKQINLFVDWYSKNNMSSLSEGNPMSDEYHKEMARVLFEAFLQIDKLPSELNGDKTSFRNEFISIVFNEFAKLVRKTTQVNQEQSTKEDRVNMSKKMDESLPNIILHLTSIFSNEPQNLRLLVEELKKKKELYTWAANF